MDDLDLRRAVDDVKRAIDLAGLVESFLGPPVSSAGVWTTWRCPFHDDRHPSFGVGDHVWKCFAGCGAGDHFDFLARHQGWTFAESLAWLAERAGVTLPASDDRVETPRPAAPVPPPRQTRSRRTAGEPLWCAHGGAWVDAFAAADGALEAWQAYKPLSAAAIRRYGFGLGRLADLLHAADEDGVAVPASVCDHERLVYPIVAGGTVQGFRGRRLECPDPAVCSRRKWTQTTGIGNWLYNGETLVWPYAADLSVSLGLADSPRRQIVSEVDALVICENPVDAVLVMDTAPGIVAVAPTNGAAAFPPRSSWVEVVAASRPQAVLVAYDHDFAGVGVGDAWRGPVRDLVAARWNGRAETDPVVPADVEIVEVIPAHGYSWRVRWRAPGKNEQTTRIPWPAGLKLLVALRDACDAQTPVGLMPWPDDAPTGYDVGQAIEVWLGR